MTEPSIAIAATEDDETIATGDVVVDLASGKALQVVGRSSQTVGEHPQTRSDPTAEVFGAQPDDRVYRCVFLPDGEKITPPSKTYAYPESRLLRYPVEDAAEIPSIQVHVRTAILQELADAAVEKDRPGAYLDIVAEAYSDDVAETVAELIEATAGGETA